MSKILTIDIGAGTMDVLYLDTESELHFKAVVLSLLYVPSRNGFALHREGCLFSEVKWEVCCINRPSSNVHKPRRC
jgi:hypothetical protein